ncbi:MAG TPA: FAD-dependent oxidoreductase [Acidimicrobiia bacterium]|nr:FAD-dependent oxidoreductase [Acidimicrobiia bacterium]
MDSVPREQEPTTTEMRNPSLWMATSEWLEQPVLRGDVTVEAVVIGAGITGLTTARLLLEHGLTVAVVESGRVCSGVTALTTAKITALQSTIYSDLTETWGRDVAAAYAGANLEGLEMIRRRVVDESISCDFAPAPATTYATSTRGARRIEAEARAAKDAGLAVTLTTESDLPYQIELSVRLEDQARFHPRRFCVGLLAGILHDGGIVFEHTRALDIDRATGTVVTDRGSIRSDIIVVASHVPFVHTGLFTSRMSASRSYAVAFRPAEVEVQGMHIGVEEPIRSVRATGDGYVIVGGESHPVGESRDTEARYRTLESWARDHFGVDQIDYRWSAQDYRSADGLPFVGALGSSGRVFFASGFAKWGMANGTIAAAIMTDLALGRQNPWAEVFDSRRLGLRHGMTRLIRGNARTLNNYLTKRWRRSGLPETDDLGRGQGAVVETGGGKAAVFRDEDGELHAVSAVCTHLGCQVVFNPAERTWDCPCHGSRYGVDGAVVHGPAVDDLSTVEIRSPGRSPAGN